MAAAAVNDCFSIGSTVLCTTCFNEEVQGEVLAFDHNSKMLILKCRSKSSEDLSDVFVLNLSLCSNVQVIKECNGNLPEDPQKLNLEQVKIRLRKTVQSRQTLLKSKNDDVSAEAQELYRVIAKQFGFNEVSWQGLNIQIFNEVTISPPYKIDNVVSSSNNENLCKYIKKMMEQFSNTRVGTEPTRPTSAPAAPPPPVASTTAAATAVSTTQTTTTTIAAAAITNNSGTPAIITATTSSSSTSSPTTPSSLSSTNAASGSPVPAN